MRGGGVPMALPDPLAALITHISVSEQGEHAPGRSLDEEHVIAKAAHQCGRRGRRHIAVPIAIAGQCRVLRDLGERNRERWTEREPRTNLEPEPRRRTRPGGGRKVSKR
jgi:hypothetical protein